MPKVIQLNLSPDQAHLKQDIQKAIPSHLNVSKENISTLGSLKDPLMHEKEGSYST